MAKNTNRTDVAEKLVELRTEKGLTGEQVAAALGWKDSRYRKYETTTVPPSANLIKLAEFFNVPLDYFTDREEKPANDDYIPAESGGVGGNLLLRNYNDYHVLDEEIGELTEQEALLISIFRAAAEDDKKKIVRYIKNKKSKE